MSKSNTIGKQISLVKNVNNKCNYTSKKLTTKHHSLGSLGPPNLLD